MNLVEPSKKVNNSKTNKIMISIGIVIGILLIVCVILFVLINQMGKDKFKFTIDGKSYDVAEGLFIFNEDKVYVSIRDISDLINYTYFNGAYKQYSEDINSCYLQGENEICTFENLSDKIYKTPRDKIDYQLLTIDEPIKMFNGKLYITSTGLRNACNIEFNYDKEDNRVTIYTLPYLTQFYTTGEYIKSGIKDNFNNQKALLYNLLVVQNLNNNDVDQYGKVKNADLIRYGVTTISGEERIGTKYTNIEFIENTQEFIVTTEEKKVGIISCDGETKIKPQYDALKQIDNSLSLYLATNNNKKGIIDKNGKILIYLEYDEIGIDSAKFETNNIKNPYIFYNNAIPVKQNNKWGMYDIKGKLILPISYDGLGCLSSEYNVNSTILIPSVEGIVFSKKYTVEDNSKSYDKKKETELYGIVNSKGHVDVDTVLDKVYFAVNNGREEYYMVYKGENYDITDYFSKYIYTQNV